MIFLMLVFYLFFNDKMIKTIRIDDSDKFVKLSGLSSDYKYKIKLTDVEISDEEYNFLHSELLDSLLIDLELDQVEVDRYNQFSFIDFSNYKNLEKLTIKNLKLTKKVRFKQTLIFPNSLKYLSIHSSNLKPEAFESISRNELPLLKHFNLKESSKRAITLKNFHFLTRLESLTIGIKSIKNEFFTYLPFDSNSNLKSFKIYKESLDFSENASYSENYPAFSKEMVFGDSLFAVKWNKPFFRNLRSLEIIGKSDSKEEDAKILLCLNNKKLQSLDIFLPFKLNDHDSKMEYLNSKMNSTELNIDFENFDDIEPLMSSFYANQLTKLSLKGNEFSKSDIIAIIESGRLPNLNLLELNINDMIQSEFKELTDRFRTINFSLTTHIKDDLDAYYWPVLKYTD